MRALSFGKLSSVGLILSMSVLVVSASGCGINEVIDNDEDVKAAWAEVQNQYQRRSDLVPNLVNVVKGAANFEQTTLQGVVEARAKVGSMQVDSSIVDNPEKLKAFDQAQGQLSSALSRLMVVVEKYPDLQSTRAFQDLQAQLEGTENRIAVARNRYVEAIATYNKTVQRFPSMIGAKIRGKEVRASFEATPGTDKAPEVKF